MTFRFIPTQSGSMGLEDSKKLLRAIFPNWPSLEPCYSAPVLEPVAEHSKTTGTRRRCLSASNNGRIRVRKAVQL